MIFVWEENLIFNFSICVCCFDTIRNFVVWVICRLFSIYIGQFEFAATFERHLLYLFAPKACSNRIKTTNTNRKITFKVLQPILKLSKYIFWCWIKQWRLIWLLALNLDNELSSVSANDVLKINMNRSYMKIPIVTNRIGNRETLVFNIQVDYRSIVIKFKESQHIYLVVGCVWADFFKWIPIGGNFGPTERIC